MKVRDKKLAIFWWESLEVKCKMLILSEYKVSLFDLSSRHIYNFYNNVLMKIHNFSKATKLFNKSIFQIHLHEFFQYAQIIN